MESNDSSPIRAFKIIQESVKQYKVEWINEEEPDELYPSTWVNKTDLEITHDLILNWIRSRVDRGSVLSYKGPPLTTSSTTNFPPTPSSVILPIPALPSPTVSPNSTKNNSESISRSRSRSRSISMVDSLISNNKNRRRRDRSSESSNSYQSTATITGSSKKQKKDSSSVVIENDQILPDDVSVEEGELFDDAVEGDMVYEDEDDEVIIVKSEPIEETMDSSSPEVTKQSIQSPIPTSRLPVRSSSGTITPPRVSPSKITTSFSIPISIQRISPKSISNSTTRPNILASSSSSSPRSTASPVAVTSHLPAVSTSTSTSTSNSTRNYIPSYSPSKPKSALEVANEYAAKRKASLAQPIASTSTSVPDTATSGQDPTLSNEVLPSTSTSSTSTIHKSSFNKCTYCDKTEHPASECRLRSRRTSNADSGILPCEFCDPYNHSSEECRSQPINRLSTTGTTASSASSPSSSLRCSTCQRSNHISSECRFESSPLLLEPISNNISTNNDNIILTLHEQAQLSSAVRTRYRIKNELCLYCGLEDHTRDNCMERLRVNVETSVARERRRLLQLSAREAILPHSNAAGIGEGSPINREREILRDEERDYSPPPTRRRKYRSPVSDDRWASTATRPVEKDDRYASTGGDHDRWAQLPTPLMNSSRRGKPSNSSNCNSIPISTSLSSQARHDSLQEQQSSNQSNPPRRNSESSYGLGLSSNDQILQADSFVVQQEVEPTRDPRKRPAEAR